jgi:transposase
MTTRILALTDALGNFLDFRLLPGQARDLRETAELIEGLSCEMLLADRAFDANWLRASLQEMETTPVIPPKSNRKFPPEFDRHACKWRHLIENFFQKLKEFKRIALRSCKTDQSYASMIYAAAALINLR